MDNLQPNLQYSVGDKVTTSTGRTGKIISTHYIFDYKNGLKQEVKKYRVIWDDNGVTTWIPQYDLTLLHTQSKMDEINTELVLLDSQIDSALDNKDKELFHKLVKDRVKIKNQLEFFRWKDNLIKDN